MKFALLLTLFITTNVFAFDICKFEETWEVEEALEAQNIKAVRVSKHYKKFTSVEKHLIHKTVTLQSWLKDATMEEARIMFSDYESGKEGSLAGSIEYYNFDGKQVILVHYYPGDNEYGAYFMINKNGSFKLLAEIDDSFISCK